MAFNWQGGHSGSASAHAGDNINLNPINYGGGGMQIGTVSTGGTTQTPTMNIGGSTNDQKSNFDFSQGGGAGGMPSMPKMPEIKMPEMKMPEMPNMNNGSNESTPAPAPAGPDMGKMPALLLVNLQQMPALPISNA